MKLFAFSYFCNLKKLKALKKPKNDLSFKHFLKKTLVEEELYGTKHKYDSEAANVRFQQYSKNDFIAAAKKSNWCEGLVIPCNCRGVLNHIFSTFSRIRYIKRTSYDYGSCFCNY